MSASSQVSSGGQRIPDVNVATAEYNFRRLQAAVFAEEYCGRQLLAGDSNFGISDRTTVIQLGQIYDLNLIKFTGSKRNNQNDETARTINSKQFTYQVEVSQDWKNWSDVANYRKAPCLMEEKQGAFR